MNAVEIIALSLLIIRLIAVGLVVDVLIKQFKLFRKSIDKSLVKFRMIMFLLGIIFFTGNLFPIYMDILIAFSFDIHNQTNLLIGYAISNAVGWLAGSILLWNVYNIASNSDSEKKAYNKNQQVRE